KARCFTQVPEHELVEMAAGGLDYSIRKKLDTQHLRDMAQLADRVRQVERLKIEKARTSKFQKKEKVAYVETYEDDNEYEINYEDIDESEKALNEGRLKFDDKSKPQMKVDSDPLQVAGTSFVELWKQLLCRLAVCDKEATAGLTNYVPYAKDKGNWPRQSLNKRKEIVQAPTIQQRLGPKTFVPANRIPVNQWENGRYAAFNKKILEKCASSQGTQQNAAEAKKCI
ncbi:hypothetical protein L195_g017656, partial [Trifolium pratense]